MGESLSVSQIQLDALREIGSVAAGNAATAFSQVVNRKVEMSVPSARVISIPEIRALFNGDDPKIGVYQKILGEASGGILLSIPKKGAVSLVEMVSSRSAGGALTPADEDLLVEFGNIVSGSYLTTLSKLTGIVFMPMVPRLSDDASKTIIDHFLSTANPRNFAFVIYNALRVENSVVSLQLVLIPDPRALEAVLQAVGMPR